MRKERQSLSARDIGIDLNFSCRLGPRQKGSQNETGKAAPFKKIAPVPEEGSLVEKLRTEFVERPDLADLEDQGPIYQSGFDLGVNT